MGFLWPFAGEIRYKLRSTKLRVPLVWFRHLGLGRDTSDVFLASFQRSGSTWLRFLLCDVLTKGAADFRNVKFTIPDVRHYRRGAVLLDGGRLIKTHEPYRKEYGKAVYIVRDPRDVALSLHEYIRPHEDLDDFVLALSILDRTGNVRKTLRFPLEFDRSPEPMKPLPPDMEKDLNRRIGMIDFDWALGGF